MSAYFGRACGKCILIGEHFVVSGTPALALPLSDLHCDVSVEPSEHPHYLASIPGNEDLEPVHNAMARAVYAASDSLRIDTAAQPLKVQSKVNFPIARGLGSSASFAIALARAMSAYRDSFGAERVEASEILKTADAVEKIFHGKPSGLDAAVIYGEQPIRFEQGQVVREFSNSAVDFIIADGGERDQCSVLIEKVAKFRKSNPNQWAQMGDAVSKLVNDCEQALREHRQGDVAEAIRQSQAVLADLSLSTPRIDEILYLARTHGALAGKVSGAGGGGAVLLVAPLGQGSSIAGKLRTAGVDILAVVHGHAGEGKVR